MSYVKTVWQTGDVITAPLLNHIEDGIGEQDTKIDTENNVARLDFSNAIACAGHMNDFDSIVCFGDSIFYGYMVQNGQTLDPGNGTMQQFASMMGLPLTILAGGDTTLCTLYTGYKNVYQQVYDWTPTPGTTPIVMIDGGTNDQWRYALTNLGEYGSTDTTTIYGAINMIISTLLGKGLSAWQIVVTTPIPRNISTWDTTVETQLRTIGFAMYQTGVAMGCNVINGFGSVFTSLDNYYAKQIVMEDDVHPTEQGSTYYANYIYNEQMCNQPSISVTNSTLIIKGAR